MSQGPLFRKGYTPHFTGHQTFPLRYGWLKKAFDRVAEAEYHPDSRTACWGEEAIARFGVGKNMVASMRHWAKAAGVVIEPTGGAVQTTVLGKFLFGPTGFDPYMEHPSTLWLIHWQIAANAERTTWFWAFSHYPAITFDRDMLTNRLERLATDCNWSRVANTTIKNDAACFIRTYVSRQPSGSVDFDDTLESPLTELGLIKALDINDRFRFVRGPKATLGDGVFTYALMDFWSRNTDAATLSFEAIAHAPGGPGRVFQLDEDDVVDRLTSIDDVTEGALQWSETAGLKQVNRNVELNDAPALSWIQSDYEVFAEKEVT